MMSSNSKMVTNANELGLGNYSKHERTAKFKTLLKRLEKISLGTIEEPLVYGSGNFGESVELCLKRDQNVHISFGECERASSDVLYD
ncbi:hypothetical protein OSB04_010418 [Centaurea solstitialis]|uniref:Uncharacterized protein n=1 Tax=Centaurea solstitialis TaxID=347529 RepID=A0AA38T979_9ASTR|nr:hypothetical protein OSB04_010418 [Centaurea solstitialis]